MGQIVKRKKKGRPSKADLARPAGSPTAAPESELRRSLRRRNVRYNIDYDDYLDEDFEEEEDEDEERSREKKLKLVLKLNQGPESKSPRGRGQDSSTARGRHAIKNELQEEAEEEEDDGEEDESERRKIKKRRVGGGEEDDEGDDDEEDDDRGGGDAEGRERKGEAKGHDSVPGTPSDPPSGLPLPDKKILDLFLDKLQKKDTYGVYAEPVDPEELPDYHDVIEHPMDFATVRKKLGNGSYSNLEQFESDVFLICSNAMQYNAPDTIYHKQARSIQELATKKFEKLRVDTDRTEKESKSEQKPKSSFVAKKQMKKPLCRTTQEPIGSDFSSGATLANAGDIQNASIITQPNSVFDRSSSNDVLAEGHSSLVDSAVEKTEELSSGKGNPSKFGRKSFVLDENRRATYNISNQPVIRSESIFTTFESEIKQLVAVGLHAEYSYARSLARFAAALGPVAWKVASRRIEQALPAGFKFGHGWVGEYEPLPTPVLMLENRPQKEAALFAKFQRPADVQKDKTPDPPKEHHINRPVLEGKSSSFRSASGLTAQRNPSSFSSGRKPGKSVNAISKQKNLSPRVFADRESKVSKQVELNLPPTSNQTNADLTVEKQSSNKPEVAASKSGDMAAKILSPRQYVPLKQLNNIGVSNGSLPNGKVSSTSFNNRMINTPDSVSNQMARAATYIPNGQVQGLGDPVQLMRILAQKQQNSSSSSTQGPVDTSPAIPSVPAIKGDDSNSAAAAAARAWMSVGAGGFKQTTDNTSSPKSQISAESLYNPSREFHPQISRVRGEFPIPGGMQFLYPSQKNSFQLQAFAPQPIRLVNEAQFQNRPMIFPQLVATDLSRFQVQPTWQDVSPQTQPRQKQETLPPDLNIGFQSPGSPAKQSSGVLVDSQQPDLALQL